MLPRFNSRAREGRDSEGGTPEQVERVSIHAPARGATVFACASFIHLYRFNSRAREGRDARRVSVKAQKQAFQFTRPRGARQNENNDKN